MDTKTPDGYYVDKNGAWVVNGVVMYQGVKNTAAATAQSTAAGQAVISVMVPEDAEPTEVQEHDKNDCLIQKIKYA